jgi:excisionase family DNA binding protein
MSTQLHASGWVRLKDAAEYLHCTERHLRELARTRRIRSAVIARKLHFNIVDLDEYISSCIRERIEQ